MALLERINVSARKKVLSLQEAFILAWNAIRFIFVPPFYRVDVIQQMDAIGVQSLGIVVLTGFFTGMVLALQSAVQMQRFGATTYVGSLVTASMIRELGPVLAGLMVAGRVGSGIAAQLGSMRVTEQIDALETLGYDPLAYLVVPRVIAGTTMFPVVVAAAMMMGIFCGWGASSLLLNLSTAEYVKGLRLFFQLFDVRYGLVKSASFGLAVTLIGARRGLRAEGGAVGVGSAATSAVVYSAVLILVLDAFWAITWLLGHEATYQ